MPDVILGAMGANPSADVRDGFAGLIEGWDSGFAELPQDERERFLLSWCDSEDVMQRAAFQALRKLTLVMYYTVPWQGEGKNPVDEAIGYPGPHGKLKDAPPKTIEPLEITEDTELDCDVVVVGSGAGGGTAAGVLAEAGLDVVVVEAGGYFSEEDFDGAELDGYVRLYLGGGGVPTPDQSIGLLAGFCLGGGTTVNYTWCFRPPDHVRQDWQDRFGLDDWMGKDFDDSLDAVWDRLQVNSENSMPSLRDERFREGLAKLGWDSQVMQRNAVGCSEEICGQCHYGCPIGAKQSTFKTWLQDAYDAGARIVVNAPVEKVVIEGGEAKGVEATTADGHKLTVRARAVAAAAGAINTPALLVRSGLDNPNVGKNLMIHPVLLVWAMFERGGAALDRRLRLHLLRRVPRHGRGVRRQVHARLGASLRPRRLRPLARRERSRRADAEPALHGRLRDPAAGARRRRGRGRPRRPARPGLEPLGLRPRRDAQGPRRDVADPGGGRRPADVHLARRLGLLRPGQRRAGADAEGGRRLRLGARPGDAGLVPPDGDRPHGRRQGSTVCDPTGEAWDAKNLFVVDGAVLPTALGVNPMITIEAAAHKIARGMAAKLT